MIWLVEIHDITDDNKPFFSCERTKDWKKTNIECLLKAFIRYFFFIRLFFHQMIAVQKLWKLFFISSKKLFSFSRYSIFCNFFNSFPHFPDTKEQMEVE